MGQYFKAVVERADKVTVYTFSGYSKLTEHSWLSNELTDAVLSDLSDNGPARVAWIGDYAYPSDICPSGLREAEYESLFNAAWKDAETVIDKNGTPKPVVHVVLRSEDDYHIRFRPNDLMDMCLANLTEKRCLTLYDYIMHDTQMRRASIFPLSILTAVGNGLGNGDYYGDCMKAVGSWAFAEIALMDEDAVPAELGVSEEQDVQFNIHGSGIAYMMFDALSEQSE